MCVFVLCMCGWMGFIQIVFEGVVTGGYQGDLALDDIFFNDGSCPVSGD